MIGLGRMGGPMADHVIAAGHSVRVHDVHEPAIDQRVRAGGVRAASPADAARDADLVGVVVLDDAQARAVLLGPEGVFATLPPGAVVAIHTTIAIETVRELAETGARFGAVVIDAGISGGEAGSLAGTLVTMVGGTADAFERVRPVLESFSKEVVHAGPLGAGMALKLARNAAGYVMMSATHEAMELAHRSGVDVALLRHVIEATGVFAQALAPFDMGGPEGLPADAPSEQRTALEHTRRLADKDLDQALALARHLDIDVPAIEATRGAFHRAVRL